MRLDGACFSHSYPSQLIVSGFGKFWLKVPSFLYFPILGQSARSSGRGRGAQEGEGLAQGVGLEIQSYGGAVVGGRKIGIIRTGGQLGPTHKMFPPFSLSRFYLSLVISSPKSLTGLEKWLTPK